MCYQVIPQLNVVADNQIRIRQQETQTPALLQVASFYADDTAGGLWAHNNRVTSERPRTVGFLLGGGPGNQSHDNQYQGVQCRAYVDARSFSSSWASNNSNTRARWAGLQEAVRARAAQFVPGYPLAYEHPSGRVLPFGNRLSDPSTSAADANGLRVADFLIGYDTGTGGTNTTTSGSTATSGSPASAPASAGED
jgi:hypothetical protein